MIELLKRNYTIKLRNYGSLYSKAVFLVSKYPNNTTDLATAFFKSQNNYSYKYILNSTYNARYYYNNDIISYKKQIDAATLKFDDPTLKIGDATLQFDDVTLQYDDQTLQFDDVTLQFGDQTLQFGDATLQFGDQTLQFDDQTLQFGDATLQFDDVTLQFNDQTLQYDDATLQYDDQTVQFNDATVQFDRLVCFTSITNWYTMYNKIKMKT